MKITEHTTTNLKIKDSAGCLWLFGLFFVVVAGFFVIGLMGAFNNLNELNQLEQTAAWVIALAGVAAGVWIIYSNPAIRVSFDKRENSVTIIRRSPMRNETESYPLNEIINIEIKESKDDEGDPIFSVEMKLKSGRSVSLTKTWLRNKEDIEKNIVKIKDFVGKH
ncbi:MAG: hypothetical protein MUF28_05780 [Ignavibacterium sp.]|jgi:hypothetical protein|nr:hypothetical protein [Ignavibacterium sp.]